jgi:membrane peptidoglycan carboxypeptidase
MKDMSARKNRVDNRRQVSNAKPRVDSRSSRLSIQRRLEQKRLEAKRLAERMAYVRAVAQQRARDAELRSQVQSMIAKDDLTGEDLEVRRAAVGALGKHAGTVVVMNPQTGQVYSMVNQQWALREGFKPCSTIKLLTGLAGLNENVIDLNDTTKISDNNQVNLTRALAYSRNEYFQQVGEQVGFDKMVSYARRLGLGEKTGINAQNEFQGSVPGPASRFAMSRMWSHGDNFQVTPIQLATLVSAMANGGKLLTPHIARTKQEALTVKTKVRRQVKMDTETWRNMVPGMVGSVVYGSGRRAFDPSETVAGKTGTCVEQGTWVGLFTSYAPLANPRLAVVVIARGADAHNHFPAAVAGRIYRDLNGRFGTPASLQVATARKFSIPARDVDSDDEEENESTAVSKNWKEASNTGGMSQARSAGNSVKTGSTSERVTKNAQPPVFKTTAPVNRVIPVLMQIPKRNQVIVKPAGSSSATPSNSSERETRPRRVFGER